MGLPIPGFLHRCWGFELRSSYLHSKRSRPLSHLPSPHIFYCFGNVCIFTMKSPGGGTLNKLFIYFPYMFYAHSLEVFLAAVVLLAVVFKTKSPSVVQADFKLMILMPQPPRGWVCRHAPTHGPSNWNVICTILCVRTCVCVLTVTHHKIKNRFPLLLPSWCSEHFTYSCIWNVTFSNRVCPPVIANDDLA